MVLVEGAPVGVHQLVVLPGLGDHHGHSVRQAPSRQMQKLQGVVEGRRIALSLLDNRRELPEVLSEELGPQAALAGVHPVDVAPYGVDLTVVRDVAVRVRKLPTPQSIGREPLVYEGYSTGEGPISQIRIEPRQLPALQEPLVDNGPRREAYHVTTAGVLHGAVQPAPDDVKLPLESRPVPTPTPHEELPDARHDTARHPAHGLGHDGHVPETEKLLAFLGADLREPATTIRSFGVSRLEEHPHAIASRFREVYAQSLAFPAEEAVRDLGQNTGPVTSLGVAARRPPVLQVVQNLETLLDRLARPTPVEPRYEPEPASIVLVYGVVKSGSRGQQAISPWCPGYGAPIFTRITSSAQVRSNRVAY